MGYFTIENFDGAKVVLIVDKNTWLNENRWSELPEETLPDAVHAIAECVYEYEGPQDRIRTLLSNLGFEENPNIGELHIGELL